MKEHVTTACFLCNKGCVNAGLFSSAPPINRLKTYPIAGRARPHRKPGLFCLLRKYCQQRGLTNQKHRIIYISQGIPTVKRKQPGACPDLLLIAAVGYRYVLDRGSALHRLGIKVHQVVYLLRQLAAYFDAHFLQFFAGYRIIMGPASLG